MCSRYELTDGPTDLLQRFGLMGIPPMPNRAEVRPTDAALIIDGGRQGRLATWGLEAAWQPGRPLINARAESLSDRRSFRSILDKRCIVPASAWFEWRTDGKSKLKNRFARRDGTVLALAGLLDGNRFTIVTCPASPELAYVHGRMPVVLTPDVEKRWIDPTIPFEAVGDRLLPFAAKDLLVEEETPEGYQPDLFG